MRTGNSDIADSELNFNPNNVSQSLMQVEARPFINLGVWMYNILYPMEPGSLVPNNPLRQTTLPDQM